MLKRVVEVDIYLDTGAISLSTGGKTGLRLLEVDCSEMTLDDQLALASAISDGLGGRAVALVKDDKLALDTMSSRVTVGEVAEVVRSFVSKRKDAKYYSVEADGDEVRVHTPDPLSRSRGRKDTGQLLPNNLLKCPYCAFVTPYQEMYDVHMRSHLFGV